MQNLSLSPKTNNPGDLISGRTFRRLNVTRKILIKDVPSLFTTALSMQTFALGPGPTLHPTTKRQSNGPALCLMVVSISEQIWSINFKQILSDHHLFIKHIRYVDNRLIFGDARLQDLRFYGKPIILETEPDQEFLRFMLETQPLELIYNGPTKISQVLSPYPPKVLLSGFRSRQGLDQLTQLYTLAGFSSDEMHHMSSQILNFHQDVKKCAWRCCTSMILMFPCFPQVFFHRGNIVLPCVPFSVSMFDCLSLACFWLKLAPHVLRLCRLWWSWIILMDEKFTII